jgi:TolB-like protein
VPHDVAIFSIITPAAVSATVRSSTMTAEMLDGPSEVDTDAVRAQLALILKSRPFHQSLRRQHFLQFLVDETLAGRGDRLKGYTIAIEVFGRPLTFDPVVDPLVRIEAARLRDKLREYYAAEGQADPVRIELPKGSYTPHFGRQTQGGAEDPTVEAKPSVGKAVDHSDPVMQRGWLAGAAIAGTGLILVLVIFGLWQLRAASTPAPATLKPSIAVLPFDAIGGDVQWTRFAAGLTEDIITDLAHSKDILVIARNSTERYKDRPADIRDVGRDLGVRYVLEGSIQPIGDRIRVTAQLIDATSNGHVWSERFDRPAGDLFSVQAEVTQRITSTLTGYQGAVAEAERSRVRRKPPASLTAYDTYLLGIEAKHRVTKDSLTEAEGLFRRAIAIDPQFARAYCGLATVQSYLIDLGLAPSIDDAVKTMTDAALKAVKFDPNDGLTHQVLGLAYAYQAKPDQSLAEFRRAEALAPSDADLLVAVAWSLPAFGETAHAVDLAERALALNPRYPDWYNQGLSLIFFFGEQYDRSISYRALVKEPLALDYAFTAMAHAYRGRMEQAHAAAARLAELDPAWNAERYLSETGGYANGAAELFVDGARKAGLPDCVSLDELKTKPEFIRVTSCDRQRGAREG